MFRQKLLSIVSRGDHFPLLTMVEGNVNNKVMLCYLLWLIQVQSDGISSLIQFAVCGFRSTLIDRSRFVCTRI